MDLFKAFGLRKRHGDDDTDLINKLHGFWTHIKHPIVGFMEREDMHTMGVDELLDRMNKGPGADGRVSYDTHPKTGKEIPSWIPERMTSAGMGEAFPTPPMKLADLPPHAVHLAGQPSPLDRNSLKAGLDNPKHWGLGDFFPGENN